MAAKVEPAVPDIDPDETVPACSVHFLDHCDIGGCLL